MLAALAAIALGATPVRALSISPNPVDLSDGLEVAARITFVGDGIGVPTGGVVLGGTVAPTDAVLMFTVEYVAQSIAPLAGVSIGYSNGLLTGMGWIPGSSDDWALLPQGTFPQQGAAFVSATLDTGDVGDVIFVSATSFPVGAELGFYFQGYHGVPWGFGSAVVVPEPTTIALLTGGLALLAGAARRH